jgi:hypothetical protein
MNLSIPVSRRSLAVWLATLFGPTVYFLLLLFADRFHVPAPPDAFVASLFYLIPLVALLVCESVVWFSSMAVSRKRGWMLFTLFAMLLQVGVLLAVIVMAAG